MRWGSSLAPYYCPYYAIRLSYLSCSLVHKAVVDVHRLYPYSHWAQLTPVLT